MDPSLYHAFYDLEEQHWWFVGRRRIVDSLLKARLGTKDSTGGAERRILDVGCGTGGMLPILSKYGRVTGIDSEPLALDYCRKRGITDVHLQESFQAGAEYDVVTLFDVLEHVPDEEGFLATVRGYLKPGGILMVTVPAFQFLWSRHDDLNRHQRRYTKRALIEVLEKSGFEVERSSYFNTLLFPGAAAVRLLGGNNRSSTSGDSDEALKQLRIGGSNQALATIFGSERHLLSLLDLPFGVSLYAMARKEMS
jgi:SAM-dependent methyltransferase